MAKRRAYRGTASEHTADAVYAARSMRKTLQRTKGFLARGDCTTALEHLLAASAWRERWNVSRVYADKRGQQRGPAGGNMRNFKLVELAFRRVCLR